MDLPRITDLTRVTTLRVPGMLSYFARFMREAQPVSRAIVLVYFALFLINPVYSRPEEAGGDALVSGIGMGAMDLVLILAAMAIFHFNRNLFGDDRKEGTFIFIVVISPVLMALTGVIIGLVTGQVVDSLIRMSSSALILVPLILMVMILLEAVIRYNDQEGEPTLLIVLAFISILLTIYTFAIIYYLNGLVVGPNGPTGFTEAFYFSGVTFTTTGYGEFVPVAFGRLISILESIMGWVTMSLITAIFIRILTSSR